MDTITKMDEAMTVPLLMPRGTAVWVGRLEPVLYKRSTAQSHPNA